ncbi:MAG: zinc ribbon domain-containing protein [Anaerolineae bacterium]|nr:zinc ribbon domain-containing protein [Anaerolineae bacterium]
MADLSSQSQNVDVEHMQNLVQCPKCGHSNAEGTRYCDNCGTGLAGVASQQARQTEARKSGLFARLRGRRS